MAPLLFSRELQVGAEKKPARRPLGDAVQAGVIANETLAYFIGRTYLFMERIGIDTEVQRWGAWPGVCFRTHLCHADCRVHEVSI